MPSENVDDPGFQDAGTTDRRTRKRAARRDHLLDLAADLVEAVGVDGVTMAALAEAADYAPASLYTYFGSRSALLSALQQRALATLAMVADAHLAGWDRTLDELATDRGVGHLARLCAFSDLFLAAPHRFPREFRLQQQLLVTAGVEDTNDAAAVVPAAMAVLDVPRRLLAAAADDGALAGPTPLADPIGELLDGHVARTLTWVTGLNGTLLVDGLATGVPVTGAVLGTQLTDALLVGWGADPSQLAAARTLAATHLGPEVTL